MGKFAHMPHECLVPEVTLSDSDIGDGVDGDTIQLILRSQPHGRGFEYCKGRAAGVGCGARGSCWWRPAEVGLSRRLVMHQGHRGGSRWLPEEAGEAGDNLAKPAAADEQVMT